MSTLTWLQQTGASFWRETYKGERDNDDFAFTMIGTIVQNRLTGVDAIPEVITDYVRSSTFQISAASRWVDGGCRSIVTTQEYFAAMAATKVAEEAGAELRIPWPTFLVEVPPGLLVSSDDTEYRYIVVSHHRGVTMRLPDGGDERRDFCWLGLFPAAMVDGQPVLHSFSYGTLLDSLEVDDRLTVDEVLNPLGVPLAEADGDRAIILMAKRAAIGLLLTMQHTANFKAKSYTSVTRGSFRDSPPPHRVIFIGKPLKVDCSGPVREAASGRRSTAPSVQTLVRGHMKRQVVGLGRRGRKVIWVEPYWRGPEDAPILARPYSVGSPT
jgi:hypothetical protein